MSYFGNYIREARGSLSLSEAAAKIDCTKAHLWELEAGRADRQRTGQGAAEMSEIPSKPQDAGLGVAGWAFIWATVAFYIAGLWLGGRYIAPGWGTAVGALAAIGAEAIALVLLAMGWGIWASLAEPKRSKAAPDASQSPGRTSK